MSVQENDDDKKTSAEKNFNFLGLDLETVAVCLEYGCQVYHKNTKYEFELMLHTHTSSHIHYTSRSISPPNDTFILNQHKM